MERAHPGGRMVRILKSLGVTVFHGLVAMGSWQGVMVFAPPWLAPNSPLDHRGRPLRPPGEVAGGIVEDVIAEPRAGTRDRR